MGLIKDAFEQAKFSHASDIDKISKRNERKTNQSHYQRLPREQQQNDIYKKYKSYFIDGKEPLLIKNY